jgi:hypothetical protein
MEQDQHSSLFGLQTDMVMQNRLKTITGWTKFIAIAGIVMVIAAALFLAFFGERFFEKFIELTRVNTKLTGLVMAVSIFFIAFAVIWFYLLLRASSLIRQSLVTQNADQLAEGIKMLRLYFIFGAIFTACSFLASLVSNLNL